MPRHDPPGAFGAGAEAAAMRRDARSGPPARGHGPHTLRVWAGTVVGRRGDDVFVELGVRMQGVISARAFDEEPRVGEVFEFTLRGQEEGLWVLSRREARSLATWENMEVESIVHARVIRPQPGGLEVKIGPLHAFLPRSHTGLDRDQEVGLLVGKTLPVEVIEIDAERQRVVVSRKLVLRRERESAVQRRVAGLKPGQRVQGRVTRVEDYGVFLRFGTGLEGLVHISNLSHHRLSHPAEVAKVGDRLEAKVLFVKRGGRRIALGVKQLDESPWEDFARAHGEGDIVAGTVERTTDFGAFVRVAPGVEGLVHRSEMEIAPDRAVRGELLAGQPVSVRIRYVDPAAERLSLSLLHSDGRAILAEEAEARRAFREAAVGEESRSATNLGALLAEALRARAADDAAQGR